MSTKINEEKIRSNLAKIKKLRAILAGKDPAEAEKIQKQKINNPIKKQEHINESNLAEEVEEIKVDNYNNNINENNNNPSSSNENNNNNLVLENSNSLNLNFNNNENQNNEIQNNAETVEEQINSLIQNQNQNPTELEIKKTQKEIFALKKKTAAQLLFELYDLIQIDDQKAYQAKMKGFVLPFSSDKVNIRLPENSPGRRIFKADPISQENLKRILKERKELKLIELEEKEKMEKLNMFENKKKAKLVNEKIKNNIAVNHDKLYATKDKIPNKYTEIKKKQENIIKEKDTKLTWDQLENLNFNHFITNREDDFNPNDLFEDIYDSDDENIFEDIQHSEKNSLVGKTKKSKDTASSYLNIQSNLNILNNNNNSSNYPINKSIVNLNSSVNDTVPESIIKSNSGKTRGSANAQYSARAYNNDINLANPKAQSAIRNLNARKQSGNNSPNYNYNNNNKHNISLHSSNEGNNSHLSIFDNESQKAPSNKNNNSNHHHHNDYGTNDSYEMQKRGSAVKSLKGVGKSAAYNPKLNNRYSEANANLKNLVPRNISPRKILNRSIEKSAGTLSNKNKRSSSKSNAYVNPNQRYNVGIQSPKSINGLNNEKINKQIYSIEKTEKMARELEKNREDQKSRVGFFL